MRELHNLKGENDRTDAVDERKGFSVAVAPLTTCVAVNPLLAARRNRTTNRRTQLDPSTKMVATPDGVGSRTAPLHCTVC